VTGWIVGGGGASAVAFDAGDSDAVPFHEVATGAAKVTPAPEVEVVVPGYRGKRFLPVLSWLVTSRLASAGATAVWRTERRHGPGPVQRELAPFGWRLEAERSGRWLLLHGAVPPEHELPPPRSFTATVGTRGLVFEADYGVFSPQRIDPGSGLLLDIAMGLPPAESVADIGTGYGALAIALLAGGRAARAAGTEADSVAAWLAERNASAAGVELRVALDADPLSIEPTPLTVCNVPTHLNARRSAALMAALAERARAGRLLAVVHAGLEQRYRRHLALPGLKLGRHAGMEHVVLEAGPA
jgi:16S rRNA G1207 methylase RsmC